MTKQADIEREFAYTDWEHSCKDPAFVNGDLRECRRGRGHTYQHASGFGTGFETWGNPEPEVADRGDDY